MSMQGSCGRQSEGSGVFPTRGVSGGYPPQRRVRFVNDAGSYSHGGSNPPPQWRSQAVSCLRLSAPADIYLALPPCGSLYQRSSFLFGCSLKEIMYFLYPTLCQNYIKNLYETRSLWQRSSKAGVLTYNKASLLRGYPPPPYPPCP